MTLNSDPHGFLVGTDREGEDGERLLQGIKGDTGKILAALNQGANEQRSAQPYTTGQFSNPRALATAISETLVATPAGRARRVLVRRDNAKFISSSGSGPLADKRASDLATAAASMVRAVQTERRDKKVDKSGKTGDAAPRGGKGVAFLKQGGAAALYAAQASQQIDPLLESAGEAANVLKRLGSIAVPAGRMAAKLSKNLRREKALPPGVKADKKGRPRDAKGRYLKDGGLERLRAAQTPAAPEGGGFLASLAAGAGGAAGVAIAARLAALGRSGITAAGAGAKGLLKRVPVVGALIDAITGLIDDYRIANDPSLSEKARGDQRVENALGTAGGLGGAGVGAAIGTAIGTVIAPGLGSVIGGALGTFIGGWFGQRFGTDVAKSMNGPDAKWQGVRGLIVGAAQSAGVDPGLLAQISTQESRNDPNARPVRRDGTLMSSAHGLGQFLDGTWADSIRKHGEKYGIPGASQMTNAQTMAFRGDAAMQANMLAELTAENVKLGRGLGGSDDAANVYALHNLGAAGGSRFLKALKANPDASVADVLSPTEIGNNRSLYQSGMGRTATMRQAYENMAAAMAAGDANAADARKLAGSMPRVSPPPIATVPGPMPAIEMTGPTRLNSPAPIILAPASPPVSQDVSDRSIAHITTGGIGRLAHRW